MADPSINSGFNWAALQGAGTVIGSLFTGILGSWLAFRQLNLSRKKNKHDEEASMRTELRKDIEGYRNENDELRKRLKELFEANLQLQHRNSNQMMELSGLKRRVAELEDKIASYKLENKTDNLEP